MAKQKVFCCQQTPQVDQSAGQAAWWQRQTPGSGQEHTSRKVLRPMARLSLAPILVWMLSITCSLADLAGTKQPTCTVSL